MRPLAPPLTLIALVAALVCLCAPTAQAAPGVRYGIQDDAWLAHGPGTLDERLDRMVTLGVDVVRFNLHWDQVEPAEGQPDWGTSDGVLAGLRARGIPAVVGLVGAPPWANGGRGPNWAPSASSFAGFARAAAERYPFVRDWLIWNEPNQVRWLRPTSPALYVKQLLNPAYAAIHAVSPGARVAGGVTAPRGSSGGVSPVAWIRGMRAAGARLDAYAHHPHPARPSDTPTSGGCLHAGCTTITMATLERLLREVGRSFGAKRIWLTEYGYQTDRLGVSEPRQALMLGQAALRVYRAPRVDMLIQYLVRDEPTAARWQSGLYRLSGAAKPAAAAFMLPLAQAGRSGAAAVLWGQVRPRSGAQSYRVQVRSGGAWTQLGGTRRTNARGFLGVRVIAPRGTLVRIWSPADRAYGAAVTIT
jgi:hypothetical protein